MKRSLRQGLATRRWAAGMLSSMSATLAVASHEPATERRTSLPLPATTACLEAQLASGRAQNSLSGISVIAVLDGRVVYRRNLGTVSPTSTQVVQSSTRFRIGSVTKPLTATAVLSLIDDGKLRLHTPAARLLPGFSLPPDDPAWLHGLDAHELLSNQGGIADPSDAIGPSDDGALAAAFYDPAFTSTIPQLVPPGTFYNYSSTNFMLAGLMAEAAAGKPYRVVVRQRVFKPLGMKRATFQSSEVMEDNDAASGVGVGTVYAPGAYDDSVERPAGMAWASADDLARFMNFILRGDRDVLSHRQWRSMQTIQADMAEQPGGVEGYGYGLGVGLNAALPDSTGQLRFYPGVKVVAHEGGVPGYRALMTTFPNQQFGYAALVNGDIENSITDSTPCMRIAAAEAIGERLPGPAPFPPVVIERERFGDYVGRYEDRLPIAGPAIVTIGPAGNVRIQFPELDAVGYRYDPVLHAVNRDNFILNLQDGSLLVTGFREGGSNIVYLRTRVTVFARATSAAAASSAATAARSAAPAIDLEALRRAIRASAISAENAPGSP